MCVHGCDLEKKKARIDLRQSDFVPIGGCRQICRLRSYCELTSTWARTIALVLSIESLAASWTRAFYSFTQWMCPLPNVWHSGCDFYSMSDRVDVTITQCLKEWMCPLLNIWHSGCDLCSMFDRVDVPFSQCLTLDVPWGKTPRSEGEARRCTLYSVFDGVNVL